MEKEGVKKTQINSNNSLESTKKHKIGWIQYPLIVVLAGAVGVGSGIFIKRRFGQEKIDYSNFDASALALDSKELLKEYEKNPNGDFTPAELVSIGLEKYRQCENSYSFTVGSAETIVNQSIRNAQIKNGDSYFEEQISKSSMVSLANRVSYTAGVDEITKHIGEATSEESANYTGESKSYTTEEYKSEYGRTLDEMFIYIIGNETVYDDALVEKQSNGNIKIGISLDPDLATYYYKIQMKNISSLDDLPTFNYVKHVYTFTSDMVLLHSYIDEKYQASMGVTVSIQNKLNTYYHANEYLKIPELNETFNYSTKGEQKHE